MILVDPRCEKMGDVVFIRDQAILINDYYLIPYSFKKEDCDLAIPFLAHLPISASHFINSTRSAYSEGFLQKNHDFISKYLESNNLKIKQATTCMEGGNVLRFQKGNKTYAVVGVCSLALSLLALEEQGLLDDITPLEDVTEEGVRIARNRALLDQGKKKWVFLNPLTPEDFETYKEPAKKWEACLQYTRSKMQKELEVNHLIIIDQVRYHIDLELFVSSKGTLFMNDDRLVIEYVNALPPRFKKNFQAPNEHAEIVETNQKILEANDLEVHLVPGIYTHRNWTAYLCNAITLSNRIITIGAPSDYHDINEQFQKIVAEEFLFLDEPAFSIQTKAGIRCISLLCSNY